MEKRKLFKFYSSYYDVANELDDENRLAFYDAIMKRQFTGVEIELKGMAKFAFISQKHSIDKQIEGWEFKMKTSLFEDEIEPIKGGVLGGVQGGSVKEEVKEKEKEEVEYTIPSGKPEKLDFNLLIDYLNKKTGRAFRIVNETVKKKYTSTLNQGYTKEDIRTAIDNAVKAKNHIDNNFQHLTLEFFSRPDKLDMYSAKKESKGIEGETEEEKDLRIRRESFNKIKVH